MGDHPGDAATASEVEVQPTSSREYELAAVATAVIDGPVGPLRVRRRYEALPRHNDVVDHGAVDSNDELVDRSNAVHVHSRYYTADASEEYLLDTHDTWAPQELSVLEGPEAFLAACRDHHLTATSDDYARLAAELDDMGSG